MNLTMLYQQMLDMAKGMLEHHTDDRYDAFRVIQFCGHARNFVQDDTHITKVEREG